MVKAQEIAQTIRKPQANLLMNTVENITIAKKTSNFIQIY